MLKHLQIKIKGKVDEGFLDDCLQQVVTDLGKDRSRISQDIYDVISSNKFENSAADDYFQVVADVISYIDEAQWDKGVDLTKDDKAFYTMIDNAILIANAVFVVTDKELSRTVDDRTFKELQNISYQYQDDIVKGLRSGNNRNDRGRNDRGREDRYDRNDRNQDRGRGAGRNDYVARGSSARNARPDAPLESGYGTARRPEPVRTERSRDPVMNSPRARNENPRERQRAHVEDVAPARKQGPYGSALNPKETPMESYEAHELRALQTPDRNNGIVIPLVNFAKTPELAVKEVVDAEPSIKELPDIISVCSDEDVPNMQAIMAQCSGNQDITVMRTLQYKYRACPTVLLEHLEGVEDFKTFDAWWMALSNMTDVVLTLAENKSEHYPIASAFVVAMNRDLTKLLNGLLSIVDDAGACVKSFVDHYRRIDNKEFTCRDWLYSEGTEDILRYFQELEPEYLRHNYAVLPIHEVKTLMDAQTLVPRLEDTDAIRFMWIRTRFLVVNYRGSIISDTLQFDTAVNSIVEVRYDDTPDFYNACARIIRLRNTRLNMGQIALTDSMGNNITLFAGKRDGGSIRARLTQAWK